MKTDDNTKKIGFTLLVLALWIGLVTVEKPSKKINDPNFYESAKVTYFLGTCPNGSSKLPEIEVKKFHSFDNSEYFNAYGYPRVYIGAFTDWNINSVHVLFDIVYLDGSTRQEILENSGIDLGLDKILVFSVSKENKIKYFTDVKKFNFRVVSACGKLRPMKIEIKISEAFKKIENKSSEALKEFTDLFSR
jgi:hypothetical protein